MADTKAHAQLLDAARRRADPLTRALETQGPLDWPAPPTRGLLEALARTVVGQQLSLRAARSLWQRLETRRKDRPWAAFLASCDVEVLRTCGLSAAKSKTLLTLGEADSAGRLDAPKLARQPHAERRRCLCELWGIGPWTVDMIGIFHFGDRDIWPDGDAAVRKHFMQLTGVTGDTQAAAADFAPYRSLLALHMWHHANTAAPVSDAASLSL